MFAVAHAYSFRGGIWRQEHLLDLCSATLASFVSSRSVRDPFSKEKMVFMGTTLKDALHPSLACANPSTYILKEQNTYYRLEM